VARAGTGVGAGAAEGKKFVEPKAPTAGTAGTAAPKPADCAFGAAGGQGVKWRAAIFDLDGTLVDSMHIWDSLCRDWLAAGGKEPESSLERDIACMTLSQSAEYAIERYGVRMAPEAIIAEWMGMAKEQYERAVQAKPGALAYLRALRGRGAKLAIATSCFPEACEAVLRRHGVRDLFSVISYTGEAEYAGEPESAGGSEAAGEPEYAGGQKAANESEAAGDADAAATCAVGVAGATCATGNTGIAETGSTCATGEPKATATGDTGAAGDAGVAGAHGRDKRYPDIWLLCAKRLGARPNECAVFEDARTARAGAKAAGMAFIAVGDDSNAAEWALMRAEADCAVESFERLPAAVSPSRFGPG
jgi:beta-phosphoglucomutase-like phosphatase (HAD superfamily)